MIVAGNSISDQPVKTSTGQENKVRVEIVWLFDSIVIITLGAMYSALVLIHVFTCTQVRFQAKNYSAQSIEAVKELDDVLVQLAVCL